LNDKPGLIDSCVYDFIKTQVSEKKITFKYTRHWAKYVIRMLGDINMSHPLLKPFLTNRKEMEDGLDCYIKSLKYGKEFIAESLPERNKDEEISVTTINSIAKLAKESYPKQADQINLIQNLVGSLMNSVKNN